MRHVVLSLAAIFTLVMAPMQPALLALGDIQVTLTCSDGIQIFDTTLAVDAEALTALQSAVEAMILYPAGLVCRLTQAPLPSASLAGGLIGPRVAVAQGNPNNDFVVGGFRVANCRNVAVSAHSDGTTTTGSYAEDQPPEAGFVCALLGPTGGGKAKVTCLSIVGNIARINANYVETHGFFVSAGFTHIEAAFADNGNPTSGPPPDMQQIVNLTGTPPTVQPPGCNSVSPSFPISDGNITVNDAGATPP